MTKLGERPTADLVIIWLAGVVGVVVIVFACAVLYVGAFTDHDISTLATRIAAIINTLIGAIVGFVAGRSTNGNGKAKTNGG